MKKRIISMFLIVSIIASLFAISAVSTSAKVAAPNVTVSNYYSGIKVSWNKVDDAKGYTVYYKKQGDSIWSHTTTYTSTSLIFNNLKSGKTYYYQVQSLGKNGVFGSYSKVRTITHLSQPSKFGGKMINNGKNLQMYWGKVEGATKYQLMRWNSNYKLWHQVYLGPNTSVTDKEVASGRFIYQVRAINSEGWSSSWSNQANAAATPKITVYDVSFASFHPAKTNIFGFVTEQAHYNYNVQWSNDGYYWEVNFYTSTNHKTPSLRVYTSDNWYSFRDNEVTRHFDLVVVRHAFDGKGKATNNGLGMRYLQLL